MDISQAARALLFVLGLSCALRADSVFKIGFSGPDTLGSGGPEDGTYYSTLIHEGGGSGVQGWSLSMTAEGGQFVSIDIDGTKAKELYADGFEHNEVTTGAGNEGAISAIILSFTQDITLPSDTTSTLAHFVLRAGPGPATLNYVDGRKGVGQPVVNVVTQDQLSKRPIYVPFEINAAPPPPPEPEACSVSLGDKVGGALPSESDLDAFGFSALDGTLLSMTLKGTGGTAPPGLELRSPDGSSIDLGPYTKVKKTSRTLKNVSLPALGAYKVIVSGGSGASPNYLLTLKGKAPKSRLSLKSVLAIASAGQEVEQGFSGLGGALLNATVKGKGVSPEILELIGPNGSAVSLGGTLIPGAKTAKIKNLVLPSTGAYVLRMRGTGPEGASGTLSVALKQKPAKGRVLSECAE